MCWNKEVSLVTFIIALCGVYYLWQRNLKNDRWIAVFAGTISMIQLAEYFMWSNPTCNSINKYASAFALFILAAEPLSNMVGGLWFSESANREMLTVLLASYIIFLMYLFQVYHNSKDKKLCGTSPCNEKSGCNMKWHFMENFDQSLGIIWVGFLLIPFLAMLPMKQGIILFLFGIASMVLASVYNKTALGSLWCWLSVGIIAYKILTP